MVEPVEDDPALNFMMTVVGASQLLARQLEAAMASTGLALAELEVLVRVARMGAAGVPMATFAQDSLLTTSGLSRLVDRLEARGLLQRRRHADDQRARVCVATPLGQKTAHAAVGPLLTAAHALVDDAAGLTKSEVATVTRILRKLDARLTVSALERTRAAKTKRGE